MCLHGLGLHYVCYTPRYLDVSSSRNITLYVCLLGCRCVCIERVNLYCLSLHLFVQVKLFLGRLGKYRVCIKEL